MKIIYEGDYKYIEYVDLILDGLEPEHKCYRTAPSVFLTLSDLTRLHCVAYHTPKSGIKVKIRKEDVATEIDLPATLHSFNYPNIEVQLGDNNGIEATGYKGEIND